MLKFDPKNIYCIDSVIFDPSHIINEDGIDKLYRGIKNVFRSRVGIYNENIVNYSTKNIKTNSFYRLRYKNAYYRYAGYYPI